MAERGVARKLLWKHKAVIVNELDVTRVLPILVRRGMFNGVEEREILSSPDARFRADLFVDRLSTKSPDAFGQLCRALELTQPNLLTRFLTSVKLVAFCIFAYLHIFAQVKLPSNL